MNLDENISAVITGGASGLGEATARELSKFGVKCALFDLNAEKGEAVASDIGGVFCEANVTSDESVVSAFEKARSINGQERILINCAGIGIAVKTAARDKKTGDIVPHPLDPFNTVIQINLIVYLSHTYPLLFLTYLFVVSLIFFYQTLIILLALLVLFL